MARTGRVPLEASRSSARGTARGPQRLDRSARSWMFEVACALALILGITGALRLAWLCDDAYISFRYADNLVHGLGLVYNAGERVEGYSNFLWTMGIALGMRLGVGPEAWTVALGGGLLCGHHRTALRTRRAGGEGARSRSARAATGRAPRGRSPRLVRLRDERARDLVLHLSRHARLRAGGSTRGPRVVGGVGARARRTHPARRHSVRALLHVVHGAGEAAQNAVRPRMCRGLSHALAVVRGLEDPLLRGLLPQHVLRQVGLTRLVEPGLALRSALLREVLGARTGDPARDRGLDPDARGGERTRRPGGRSAVRRRPAPAR